ncbi:LptA/OstA family protein [Sphingomonas ursincola]|uniref:OstA family protein n=1 Tax=Sphingomonas ursincola TaxID=56361 RepID=A0A7V8RDD6_9SPHN|nr:LptA/OstA family protein [Sphingomonas ursincola]MBA1374426.1 OstA family protein [Sphingomonas ursincola]
MRFSGRISGGARRALLAVSAGGIAMAGLVLSPASVTAQSLMNHNSNAPVDYAADRIELQDRANRVLLSGNVDITQAGLRLQAARMTVAYRNAGGIEIERIDANGGVVVTKGEERASGNVGIYDFNRRIITLIGNVALRQGGNTLNGGRMVIDLTTGRSTVDGRSAGGAPGQTGSAGGRVSGTFSVPKRD